MKREKMRFGFFDWCILTLAAVLLAVGAFLFWKRGDAAVPTVEVECLLRLPASNQSLVIAVGDEVRNENGTIAFGKVTSISERPQTTVFLKEGEPVYEAVEGMKETELTVRMTAEKTTDYRVDDIRICAGSSRAYRIGSSYVANVRMIRLSEVKK